MSALILSQPIFATGLRDYVSPSRMMVGTAISSTLSNASEPTYAATAAREYNLMTHENAMKWSTIHPAKNTYHFATANIALAFAKAHGMHMRGHTLLWKNQLPSWLSNGGFSAAQLKTILVDHITTVMTYYRTQYPGIITHWDVVNEIINAGPGIWAPLGGSGDQITQAFNIASIALHAARAADPTVKLCINEYSMEKNAAATKTWQLVKRLKQAGVPLDCVGFQGHIGSANITKAQWIASLTAFTQLGVEVQITEFDTPGASPVQYSNAVNACLAVPQCTAFVSWGFTDKYTWLGTSQHPLPFDEFYQKKPAYDALAAALSAASGGSKSAIRVDVGAVAPVTDPSEKAWSADTGFMGGTVSKTTDAIAGTAFQALYQTSRYGNFTYSFSVPNGQYTVLLKFAEIYWNTKGKRIFNVFLNNTQILQNLDIAAAAGASWTAYDRSFPVTVRDGKISLRFQSILDNAIVSAISILPA